MVEPKFSVICLGSEERERGGGGWTTGIRLADK